jgi:Flp pilus assembly protein TadG
MFARLKWPLPRHRQRCVFADKSGSALIEAALALPILIILFFGVSELCEGFTASRRVAAAAYTAADLVARLQTVSSADLAALKSMIDETFKPLSITSVGLVITSVVADGNNVTTVAWSDAFGSGITAYAANSPITLPAGLTLPNTSVIFSKVTYTYHSTLATLIVGGVPLQAQAYQQPRFTLQVARGS